MGLEFAEFIMGVEYEFGVEIDEAVVPALNTFGDFVDYTGAV